MKPGKFTLNALMFSVLSFAALAQPDVKQSDMDRMNRLKAEGRLTGKEQLVNHNPTAARITPPSNEQTGKGCECWIERDTSWQIVPFDCSGGSGGPGLPPEYRNDDWSACVTLPFNLCFYGLTVTDVYINNNGNISIGSAWSTFTAEPFPDSTYSMIAPFWADVDTRGPGSGLVFYKLTSTYLIVQWDEVGYYDSHDDWANTFQLIISNGTDPIIPGGQNVSFCYKDMQWTTGDASSGTGGFGGDPATVGVNQGNGIDYFQIGQYDAAGTAWDGPYGLADQVSSLDNQSFTFNVCNTTSNTPPIALVSSIDLCDTLVVCEGDSVLINAGFLSPEGGQLTDISIDTTAFSGISIVSDSIANVGGMVFQITGNASNLGYHNLFISATDNGSPPLTTFISLILNIINCQVGLDEAADGKSDFSLSPNPAGNQLTLNFSPSFSNNTKVEILDQFGRLIRKTQTDESTNDNMVLDLAGLQSGVYFIQVTHNNRVLAKRFVKE